MSHFFTVLVATIGSVIAISITNHNYGRSNQIVPEIHSDSRVGLTIHEAGIKKKKLIFKYPLLVDPNRYRPQFVSPRIMKYLPLTEYEDQMADLNPDIEVVRRSYLSAVGNADVVEMGQAFELAHLFDTDLGKKILDYFQGLSEEGFNYYNLTSRNYKLWLAIKIIANKDIKKYARSVAEDLQLFKDFYLKAYMKKLKEIEGISSPSSKMLQKINREIKKRSQMLLNQKVTLKPSSANKNATNKTTEKVSPEVEKKIYTPLEKQFESLQIIQPKSHPVSSVSFYIPKNVPLSIKSIPAKIPDTSSPSNQPSPIPFNH